MKVANHTLSGDQVTHQNSPNVGGKFKAGLPDTIVIHYTGGSSAQSSANWLCDQRAKASAHVVIGTEGEIIQLVSFDTIAWHAGRSSWEERSGLNQYSLGIEIDNPGQLVQRVNGFYTSFGTKVPDEMVTLATHRNQTKPTYWHAYTAKQIATVEALCQLLIDTYPIRIIVAHEEISPGRKVDPGPAYPLDTLRNKLLYQDRSEEGQEQAEEIPTTQPAVTQGYVNANLLNIRSLPSVNGLPVAPPLSRGTLVKVKETQGGWSRVVLETEGWVSSEYIKL